MAHSVYEEEGMITQVVHMHKGTAETRHQGLLLLVVAHCFCHQNARQLRQRHGLLIGYEAGHGENRLAKPDGDANAAETQVDEDAVLG